jgi:hypothetical protein
MRNSDPTGEAMFIMKSRICLHHVSIFEKWEKIKIRVSSQLALASIYRLHVDARRSCDGKPDEPSPELIRASAWPAQDDA